MKRPISGPPRNLASQKTRIEKPGGIHGFTQRKAKVGINYYKSNMGSLNWY